MRKISKAELTALVALVSLTTTGSALAAQVKTADNPASGVGAMGAVEHQTQEKLGSPSACGKGTCGTDTKGAKKAQEVHKRNSERKAKKNAEKAAEGKTVPAKPAK